MTPVLAGAAAVHGGGEEAADLMVAALQAAADDAGAARLVRDVTDIAVPHGTWSYTDPGRLVAARVGASAARSVMARVGVSQQRLVNRALGLVTSGAAEVVAVVGADTKARSAAAERAGSVAIETDQGGAAPDELLEPAGELMARAEVDAGVWDPVAQYALIDNALGRAEGKTVDGWRDEISELWSRFSEVAAANPHAAFGAPRPAAFLREPGPENRMLAFPYNKWHSTQWRVDQAAALLICSAEAARRAGADPDRCVHPLVALESSHALSLSRRRDLHRWPAMRVLGDAAQRHLARPLASVEHVELYSCFPAAVRVQQRELGLPLDGTPTVTGGMAFAGGPFNNFTYQATVEVVRRCRAERGSLGMVTTVSGLLTKPGVMVWSTEPMVPLLVGDMGEAAAAATVEAPLAGHWSGPAQVRSYTVLPEDRVVVIADTETGRVVAAGEDAVLAKRAVTSGLIGETVQIAGTVLVPAIAERET